MISGYGQDNLIFNYRHLTVEDGLLGRRVSGMVQDDDGFIWIATNEGLNRFDGYTFEHFTKSTHGLNASNIAGISKDDKGDIWITYPSHKLFGAETQILQPKIRIVLSLKEKLGKQYKEEHKDLKAVGGTQNKCIALGFKMGNGKRYIYKNGQLIENEVLNKAYNEVTDELWGADKENSKIFKINYSGEVIDSFGYTFPLIEHINIATTNKGGFFVHGRYEDKPVMYYKNHKAENFKEVKPEKPVIISRNLTNSFELDGTLYFEYNDDLIAYDIKNLPIRIIRNSIFDNQGNLWLGTNNGVFILSVKQQRFNQYLKDDGKDKTIYDGRGIWADNEVMYTVSQSNSYRYQFKNKISTLVFTESLNVQNKPISILRSKNNSFWVGTKIAQLWNVDMSTGNVIKTVNGCTNQLWALYEDKNDRVWIGQGNNGLYYYDRDKMEEIQKYNQLNGFDKIEKGKIIHITGDRRNNNILWLACQSGWYLLDINKGLQKRYWSKAKNDSKIFGDEIQYTYQDADGIYWLATAYSGLVKVQLSPNYEVTTVEQFTIAEGFSSNTIYAIYEDDQGSLWMSTNNGINRFDKKTEEVQVFLEEDGLPHYEFNRLSNFQRADGTIFFGTLNGIVSFHPKDLRDIEAYNVPLKIARCEKFSNETEQMVNVTADVITQNKIIIQPNERLTNIYISIQNYANALKTKYIYRIKGIQDEFIAANKNEISLSGLPYGVYTLEIKAKAPDGRFSEQMISMPLIIVRPFYFQWWFIALTIIGLILSVWQLFQARTKVLQARKRELEEIVKDRTAQLRQQATQLQSDKNTIEEQAKELRSLDEMKSRFFANISHELRTPLTLILSPAKSILKRKKTDNRDFTSAQIIEQNAQKLLKRINEILDLTKLEAQEMNLKPQPTPFYEFIKRLVATFESLAAQKNQQLSFHYQLDKDLTIQLDQDKYEHIFNNYLSNAIKYTPNHGAITVHLSEKAIKNDQNQTENHIVLAVKDNGQGILTEDIPKIFDRFFQSKNDQNKKGSSGIGLALAQEIAKLMNGKVCVESTIGEGSTFYFEMPYVEAVSSSPLPVSSSSVSINLGGFQNLRGLEPSKDKTTILLVEDNPQLRNYIQLILQEKYNVITAGNGGIALDKLTGNGQLATGNPQLVISDIMMPEMDGFELLEHLKASDELRHIPVIMLTARSNAKDKLKALRIGVDDYILKPFEEEELLARIDNLIQNVKERRVVDKSENENPIDPQLKQETPKKITAADLKWLEKVEEQLKSEVSNSKFNIDSLAEVMNLSRGHLHRRIKSITGLTPNKYFREIKLQKAREILEQGEAQTVNEVCYAVGFDTPKYFSKVFEKRFGKRPVSYLK